jgi:pimeloyl-ACP methyl ester carboxylesterase
MDRRTTSAAFALAGLAGVAGGALGVRHVRLLARDEEYARLCSLPAGEALLTTSADGTRLHAEVFGSDGEPTIVLVPGWTERLTLFDAMTQRLVRDGFRVVAYDLRGQGRSQPAAGRDYGIARYGDDLEAVLEAVLGPARGDGSPDVIVAGHSLGAMSIAAWAADHDVPSRVRAAALINTGLEGLIAASKLIPPGLPPVVATALATHAFLGNPLPLPPVSSPVSHALIRFAAFGPGASMAHIAFYERMLTRCDPAVRTSAGLTMADMDLLPDVPKLTVPTLVVAGELDRLTPPSHSERIAEALPQLDRLIVIEGMGHMGPLERPDEIVRALTELAAGEVTPASPR